MTEKNNKDNSKVFFLENESMTAGQKKQYEENRRKLADLAIKGGYSGEEIAQSPNGFLGELLVNHGVINRSQQMEVLRQQRDLRRKGDLSLRYGDIIVKLGYCSKDDVENTVKKADEEREEQTG